MESPKTLPARESVDFTTLLRTMPPRFPLAPDACRCVLEMAAERSSLEARVLLSRLFWLVGPADEGGIGIFDYGERLSAKELAKAIVHPRDCVLEAIRQKSGQDADFLRKIYEGIYTKGAPGNIAQLADMAEERILQEMMWWLTELSFPEYYFKNTSPALIARQIQMNRAYELAGVDSEAYSRMKVSSTAPDGTRMHWVHRNRSIEVEEEIEREYYEGEDLYDVSAYAPLKNLMLYTVCHDRAQAGTERFEDIAPRSFIGQSDEAARARYEGIRAQVLASDSIVVAQTIKPETGERRAMIGFPLGFIKHFQANISRIMARNGVEVTRKYTVTFGGPRPVIIASLYASGEFPADLLSQLVAVSLYPSGQFAALVEKGAISPDQASLVNAVSTFVHQFITVPNPDLDFLAERFGSDPEMSSMLLALQARSDHDTYRITVVNNAFAENPEIILDLWALFASRFDPRPSAGGESDRGEGGAARFRLESLLASQHLAAEEGNIVSWAIRFIDAIERTNFFLPVKGALSFRIASGFFARGRPAEAPFGIFYVSGRDFHGFHIRFKDIARGGIKLLRSRNWEDWVRNRDSLFDDCWHLAKTQDRKNKDIPEGGAQGVILPSVGASDAEAEQAFCRYVDALLDLILPGQSASVANWKEEILFLGPDEGTVGLMDWACRRSRERGYRQWMAFTTGKGAGLGGISHKEHGMATQGIHRFVLGILERLGLPEDAVTKVQIGGPDGDLGGNEILVSRDRTIAVVDVAGLLYDPEGLDRAELARLVRAGSPSSGFDESRLGPEGFKVGVADKDKRLPGGEIVASGLGFRNAFHLDKRIAADLFLPCGGRPKSITLTNWRSLLNEEGEPRYRWIVEGANLYITQEARLKLEGKGILLFKDSSTNKGGVISSSLEVLAGLALDDEEYERSMVVRPGAAVPDFRERYVKGVKATIADRADREFSLLWDAHRESGTPISILSERLSAKIDELTTAIGSSELYEQEALRRSAFRLHVPAVLLELVGIDALARRVPDSYLRAVFARALASGFVYRFGVDAGPEEYRAYIDELSSGE
jgi:glutamate dehydrogenase